MSYLNNGLKNPKNHNPSRHSDLMCDKPITIDIWGSCVSRDIFGLGGDNGIIINNHFQGCSVVAAFCNHTLPQIDYYSLS